MKLRHFRFGVVAAALLVAAAFFVPCAAAQNPDNMMPEQSEAKGKQILRDLIAGLISNKVEHNSVLLVSYSDADNLYAVPPKSPEII